MRLLTLTAVAASVVVAPQAEAFSLSSISSLLSNYGVNVTLPDREINLPPRAEAALAKVYNRAGSTLDRLFGEGGPLAGIDFPDIDLPTIDLPEIDIPEIVLPGFPEIEIPYVHIPEIALPNFDHPKLDEILDNVRDRVAEVRSDVKAKVEAKLSKVADHVESVIDRIEDRFPNSDLPGRLEEILDRAHGVIDDILDCETPDEEVLVTQAALESQLLVSTQSMQMASSSAPVFGAPASASVTIPEPTSAMLGAVGLLLAGAARRRR